MTDSIQRLDTSSDKKLLLLKDILKSLSMVLFILIIFSGTTFISAYKNELLIGSAFISLFTFIVSSQKLNFLNITAIMWLFTVTYMFATSFYSVKPQQSFQYTVVYLCCFVAMITQFTENDYKRFLKIAEIVGAVFVISVLLEVVFKELMTNYLSFVFPPSIKARRVMLIARQINVGIFSGLSGEKGEAAYVANIFIAIQLCRMFSEKSFQTKRILLLLLGFLALMLTSKRTLFAIPFFVVIVFILLNKIKGKYIKLLLFACSALCAVYVITLVVPQAAITVERLFRSSDDTFSGRTKLWKVCIDMFNSNPLFGKGLASFNHFANLDYNVGIMAIQQGAKEWTVQAHSVYYQMLGELGIIGFLSYFGVIAYTLVKTVLLNRFIPAMSVTQKTIYHFSVYFQLWFVIYGYTGNVGHYTQDLVIYFIAAGMYLYLKKTFIPSQFLRKDSYDENSYSNFSKSC